ncbi:MAG: acyl dehydratase [Streptosporangiales bacterium]|nr:acyl dehydratase [Streptosporangiales bacterium]
MRQRHFEDVEVGMELTPVTKGPMTSMHLMRWSSAIENWHRIHYDRPFATDHDGLPDVLVNGSWKQHVLAQLIKDFAGPSGWPLNISFSYRGMDVRGATITAYGEVSGRRELARWGVVECTIGMRNENGDVTTTGTAHALLPRRDGPPVPYPLPPSLIEQATDGAAA